MTNEPTNCWAEVRASKKQGNEAASILDFVSLQDILHPISVLTALRHPNKLPTEQTMHEGSSAHRTSQPRLQETLPVGGGTNLRSLAEYLSDLTSTPGLEPSSLPVGLAMRQGG